MEECCARSLLWWGKGTGTEGKRVFFHCSLDDLTALLMVVWMKDVTEAENHSLRTKLAQTKVQRRILPFAKSLEMMLPILPIVFATFYDFKYSTSHCLEN